VTKGGGGTTKGASVEGRYGRRARGIKSVSMCVDHTTKQSKTNTHTKYKNTHARAACTVNEPTSHECDTQFLCSLLVVRVRSVTTTNKKTKAPRRERERERQRESTNKRQELETTTYLLLLPVLLSIYRWSGI
jgi:hypothetical protein